MNSVNQGLNVDIVLLASHYVHVCLLALCARVLGTVQAAHVCTKYAVAQSRRDDTLPRTSYTVQVLTVGFNLRNEQNRNASQVPQGRHFINRRF